VKFYSCPHCNITIFKPSFIALLHSAHSSRKNSKQSRFSYQLKTQPLPPEFIEPQNLQKSRGKILTKQSDKEAGRRVRRMQEVKFLPKRSVKCA